MQTIAVLSQKGGAGKTTLACALAVAAEAHGITTAVVDLDPQGSATRWAHLREAASPVVTQTTPGKLVRILRTALQNGAGLGIIDTAPHATDAARTASEIADLALIPCRASAADLAAIGGTIAITRETKTKAFAVLCAAPIRHPLVEQARTAIAGYGIRTAPAVLHQRVAHVHAFTGGLSAAEFDPAGKAAGEIEALFTWVWSQFQDEEEGSNG